MNNMELETDIEALDMEMGDVTIHYCPVIPNPEGEPTAELKTAEIEGEIYEIVDEEARTELENKVDKEEGKGLSENDYTDEDKAIVDGVTEALNGKVDKVQGKGLSTNDYDDTAKEIVDGVTSALDGKADKSNTYTKSEVNSALDGKADKSNTYTKSETDNLLSAKANTSDLSTVATSGSYNDLSNTPNLSTVATSGDYGDLENKPNLSTVATSGSYNDLTDKPTIDTAISPTSTNAVQNKVIYDLLNDLLPEAEATGNPIAITNASGLNAKSLKVELEPIQDLHGYDKPWVGGGGKNKIEPKMASYSYNGISCTNNGDGSFTLNGTASGNATFRIDQSKYDRADNLKSYTAGSYTVSGLSDGIRLIIMQNSTWSVFATFTTNGTQTASEDKNNCFIYLLVQNGITLDNVTIKPQLESGSTASAWSPYSNICPISGRTQTTVKRCGKNLFNPLDGRNLYLNNVTLALGNGGTCCIFETKIGNTYTISGVQGNRTILAYTNKKPSEISSGTILDGKVGESITLPYTFVASHETYVYYANTDFVQNIVDKFQLEVGSSATTYEPYTEADTTVQFGQIVYGGEVKSQGGTSENWKSYNMTELSWNAFGGLTYGRLFYTDSLASEPIEYQPMTEIYGAFEGYEMVCNFGHDGVAGSATEQPLFSGRINAIKRLYIRTQDDWNINNFLASINNTKLVIKTTTPTTIDTPAFDIPLNKGNNTLTADGDMELKYSKTPQ